MERRLVGRATHGSGLEDGAGGSQLESSELFNFQADVIYQVSGIPKIRSKGNQATGHEKKFHSKK